VYKTVVCADCPEGTIACPNYEFECMSLELWTRCFKGPHEGQCIAKRHECSGFDVCVDNFTFHSCRKFSVVVFSDGTTHDIQTSV